MAGGRVDIKPWEVRGEAREFDTTGDELAHAAQTLRDGLAALGTPWGDDEPGAPFGAAYGGARDSLLDAVGHLATQLRSFGDGLRRMADNAEANEDQVTGHLDELRAAQARAARRYAAGPAHPAF